MGKGRDGTFPRFWTAGLNEICVTQNPGTAGLTGILVPRCRDLLSRGILVPELSHRFLSRSRLSRGFEFRSRSQSRGIAGPGPGPGSRQIPGQPPIQEEARILLQKFFLVPLGGKTDTPWGKKSSLLLTGSLYLMMADFSPDIWVSDFGYSIWKFQRFSSHTL